MQWQSIRNTRIAPLVLAGLLLPLGSSNAADVAKRSPKKSMDQQVAESEARVRVLQERVDRLEGRLDALTRAGQPSAVAPAAGQTSAQPPASSPAPSASPPVAASGQNAAARRTAPGTFEVDEDAAQRALERTLTQSGALLLRPGTFELTPTFSYARTEQTIPLLTRVVDPQTGATGVVLANQRIRRNEFAPRLNLRAGLPLNSQLEIGLPFNYVRSSQVGDLGGESADNGNGLGDLSVGIAKTLLREKGWQPDLIGRAIYNFGTGKRQDANVVLGSGYRQFQAGVVALKRQDPLAFTASAAYTRVFERDSVKPGDAMTFSLGTVLAASPATSLQLGFSQIYRQKQELNGVKIAGSEQTYGIINLGASSVLSRDMTLVTQFGIGLGNDAPKYSIGISLPILFR
jgi:hypothetical protein